MYGKNCDFCGGPLDRRGKFCSSCKRILGTKFNRENMKIVSNMKLTVTQKYKCMKCPDLEACLRIRKLTQDVVDAQIIQKIAVRI
jgi:hypothetical protein